jgi:drug/metabolite transporter (DMT)-like permease
MTASIARFWTDLNPNVRGAALVATGALFLTLMVVIAKFLGDRLNSLQITFVRSFVGLLFVLPLAFKHGRNIYRTRVPWRHLQRGGVGILGNMCLFYSVTHLLLADAMALQFSRPLWGIVLAALVLKEAVGWRRGLATIVGFAGILVMTRPFGQGFDPDAIVGVMGALFASVVIVSIKQLARSEGTMVIMFYYAFWGAVLSFIPAVFVWHWPSLHDWLLLTAVGFVGIVGQTLITQGVRQAETTVVLPFDYLRIVYAFGIGLWLFGEVPNEYSVGGTAIIVASTLYILIREARQKRQATAAA